MSVVHAHRQASIDEIAAEMDRRGTAIEKLEAERNLFKGKYRAILKLVSRTRDKLVHITDHIEDEGDRRYFGSTNDADALRDLYDEMMSWVWDATDETNRMKSDPYADIRKQRTRAEKAEATIAAIKAENERLRDALDECEDYFDNTADADHDQDGFIPNKEMQLLSTVRAALNKQEG